MDKSRKKNERHSKRGIREKNQCLYMISAGHMEMAL
jgi:hypothetical protein